MGTAVTHEFLFQLLGNLVKYQITCLITYVICYLICLYFCELPTTYLVLFA